MKINYHFEISSKEVKELGFALLEGFVKAQKIKTEIKKENSPISDSIRRKDEFNRRHKERMAEIDRRHKERMAEIDRQHKQDMEDFHKKMEEFRSNFHKKMEECRNKKCVDIDINTLPEDIKKQIALDYLKKHPLSEDKQEAIAKEYIRKYGVIK